MKEAASAQRRPMCRAVCNWLGADVLPSKNLPKVQSIMIFPKPGLRPAPHATGSTHAALSLIRRRANRHAASSGRERGGAAKASPSLMIMEACPGASSAAYKAPSVARNEARPEARRRGLLGPTPARLSFRGQVAMPSWGVCKCWGGGEPGRLRPGL